jgi:hypothetical protein
LVLCIRGNVVESSTEDPQGPAIQAFGKKKNCLHPL